MYGKSVLVENIVFPCFICHARLVESNERSEMKNSCGSPSLIVKAIWTLLSVKLSSVSPLSIDSFTEKSVFPVELNCRELKSIVSIEFCDNEVVGLIVLA